MYIFLNLSRNKLTLEVQGSPILWQIFLGIYNQFCDKTFSEFITNFVTNIYKKL